MSDNSDLKPFHEPPDFPSGHNTSRMKLAVLTGFVILAIGVFVVVFILPGLSDKQGDNARVEPEPAGPVKAVNEDSALKVVEARELLQKILKLQAGLENEGVKVWGVDMLDTSYSQAITSLAEADAYLADKFFDKALNGYRETIVKFEQLAASRPERFRLAMHAGDEALTNLEGELAKKHYKLALAADSANSEALVGLQRAEDLPQVLDYIAQGKLYESEGNLDLARQMYNNAALLDNAFQPALDHLRDVDELILNRDFKRYMSDAISALNNDDIEQAKRALGIVKNLRPDSGGVRDLEQQVEKMALRIELKRQGLLALQFEQTEEWEMAVKVYSSVLKMDANAGFAQQGKLRAKRYLALNREVQDYLLNPDNLRAPEHMVHAREIYKMAVVESDIGPKFRDNTEKLHNLIELYIQPVSIVIQSDDLTDITIYRVGKLGHFLEHRLELPPGSYKALGVRSGYRDVSLKFTVPAAGEEIKLTLFCKEEI